MADAIRILFVDDEENILSALRRLFRKAPWECSYVTSGEEALEQFRTSGAFDLVVSDQRMPGMCGVELLQALRLQHPSTVRMMLSSYTDVDTVLSAINEGYVFKFLTKPWKNEVLYQTVAEIAEALELRRENQRLLARLREQSAEIGAVDWLVKELEGFETFPAASCPG
jgi:DNA-binding NtrC family response regulator